MLFRSCRLDGVDPEPVGKVLERLYGLLVGFVIVLHTGALLTVCKQTTTLSNAVPERGNTSLDVKDRVKSP